MFATTVIKSLVVYLCVDFYFFLVWIDVRDFICCCHINSCVNAVAAISTSKAVTFFHSPEDCKHIHKLKARHSPQTGVVCKRWNTCSSFSKRLHTLSPFNLSWPLPNLASHRGHRHHRRHLHRRHLHRRRRRPCQAFLHLRPCCPFVS